MNLEYNFDNTVLLRDEMKSLRKLKRRPLHKDLVRNSDRLYKADLIGYDLSNETDDFGCQKHLDTVHISDKGLRFLVWTRRQVMKSIFLPIILSVVTTLVLYTLEHWLLPKLLLLF